MDLSELTQEKIEQYMLANGWFRAPDTTLSRGRSA